MEHDHCPDPPSGCKSVFKIKSNDNASPTEVCIRRPKKKVYLRMR